MRMNYFKLKFLLLFFALAVAIPPAWAGEESVTFLEQGYTDQQEITSYEGTNFSISFDKGTNKYAPKYFNSGTAIRVYGGNTMTVTSEKVITKIELSFATGGNSNAITTDVETYSDGTWTGSSNSVKFTVGGTTGHRRISSVKVTYTEGGDTPPAEENIYQKVTNASQLVAGKTYIIVNESANVGMGAVDDNRYGTVVTGLEFADGKVNIGGTEVTELTLGGEENAWTFMLPDNDNKYLARGNGDNKFLLATYTTTNVSKWAINLSDGCSIINNDDSYPDYRYIKYEKNRFDISSGSNIALYVKYEGGDEPQPADVTLSFPENSYTATLGETFNAPTLSVDPADAASEVTYSSSNTGVAMVDEETGAITLVAAGTTTITAEISGSETYQNATASYTLTVEKAPEPSEPMTFVKVKSTDDVTSGNYLIVYEDSNVALDGSLQTLDATGNTQPVEIVNDMITTAAQIYFTYDANAKTMKSASGFFIGHTGTKNTLDQSATNGYVNNISFDSNENALIVNNADNYELKFNKSSGQERFRYFSSGNTQQPIQLYKEYNPNKVATPTFSPAAGTYTEVQNVEINCTTDGATIYYTTDGNDPTTSSAVYSTAIEVAQNMTIKAMAVKEGMTNSNVATAEYIINLPQEVATITAAQALGDNATFNFTGNAVVTFHNGNHLYIRDGSDSGLIYGVDAATKKYDNGDVLTAGWKAKNDMFQEYTPEFTDPSNVGSTVNNGAVEPLPLTTIELGDVNKYAKIDNVTITSNNGQNYYYKVGENQYCLRRAYTDMVGELEVNKTYNVTGVVTIFRSGSKDNYIYTPQLNLITATIVKQDLELAFEPTAANAFVGENVTEPALKGLPEGLAVTYSSSNTEVATVDANTGEVTAVAAGEAVITATFKGNNEYNQATATYTLTVKAKENVTLTFDKENVELYAGQKFTAPTLSGLPEGATVTYTVTNTDPEVEVAKVENNVVILTGNAGTATVTATYAGDASHNSATATYTITVKAKKEAGLAFDPTTATAEAGAEEFTTPTLVNPNNLSPITYKSSDENVAAFVDGVLVIGDAGETTITATFAGNEEFNEGSASYTLTVTKKDAGLKYEQAELTVYAGNDFTAPTLVNPNKLSPITYSSDNETVAMVDDNTGEVVLMDEIGDAKITATFAGNGQYNEATASYTIHVIAKKTATLTFDPTQVTVYVGTEEITQPTLTTNPNNLSPITYSSDNENVAMVDDKTGEVVLMDEIGNAKITATFAGNDEYAKAEASYTITVEAKPAIIVDFESLTMAAKVGETATATFNVLGTDLKEVVTLTLNDANGVYTINPESNISIKDAEEGATVTVTYKPTAAGSHEATISVTTKDAETATVTLNGTATVPEVVAMPTFSLVAGSYTGPQTVIIDCATEGATISYSTDGGSTWTEGNTVNVDKDMTIMAKAEMNGMTVSTTASATYVIITEEAPETVNIETGYYQIKNLGNGLYANVAGRKTLNFTDEPADKAGTVIYVDVENDGTVKSLRSQAADLQGYADRAMSYVPEVVKIVAQKLNADGSGEILGETGLNKILDKFNECFDHNLHVEQAGDGYRLYGKTPSMQPVVEFYRENKDKVEAKLPNLEAFINSALEKLKAKIGGSSVFTEFKLHDIWDKMGGTLTEPVDEASIMAFYREVLNNKNYVWDFAYQTAMIYVNNLMSHPRWPEVEEQLGEYAQYIDKIKQIRPEFKYYIVQKDGKPDFISEGNKDIIDNAERTIWTLEPRTDFTVNFPEANKHNGEYVTTLYTDFAYTLPEGVTAYTVTKVSTQGVATLTALEGTIPAQTPVLLKSTAAGPQAVTLSTKAGTAPADNLLVGPDYLIKTYEIKTPQVEKIFEIIQNKLPGFYEEYVAQYEYLMLKTAGTVGNKYFWGLNKDEIIFDNNCVVRSLDVQDGTVAFYDNATVSTNKAFLVDDANNPQDVIKLSLRGDINKDGVISIIDVTALIDILLDLPARTYLEPTDTYPKGLDYEAANVNENEKIEITDVTTLIDILLNMPDQPAQGSGN